MISKSRDIRPFIDLEACSKDLEYARQRYLEFYTLHGTVVTVKSLDLDLTDEHDIYGDVPFERRVYHDYELHTFGPLDPMTYNAEYFGIIGERRLEPFLFTTVELDLYGLELKPGDLIIYQGRELEILTVVDNAESYFLRRVCLEKAVATRLHEKGS